MEFDKRAHREAINQIRKVLLESWDPMGMQDDPTGFDEYDNYVTSIFSLLASGAKERQLIDYLKEVETELMGLDEPTEDDLKPVAKQLLGIKVSTQK